MRDTTEFLKVIDNALSVADKTKNEVMSDSSKSWMVTDIGILNNKLNNIKNRVKSGELVESGGATLGLLEL